VLLNVAHHIHDALENLQQVAMLQGPSINFLDLLEHDSLPIRFINRQVRITFQPSDFLGSLRTPVEYLDQLAVDLVDSPAPVCYVHG
jgi:hypothetical protein